MSDEFNPNLTQRLVAKATARVIPNWRSRLRDYSTIALASVSALMAVWLGLPQDIKAAFPPQVGEYFGYCILGVSTWGTIGKFLTQPRPDQP